MLVLKSSPSLWLHHLPHLSTLIPGYHTYTELTVKAIKFCYNSPPTLSFHLVVKNEEKSWILVNQQDALPKYEIKQWENGEFFLYFYFSFQREHLHGSIKMKYQKIYKWKIVYFISFAFLKFCRKWTENKNNKTES